MVRHILFRYDDNHGARAKSYVDASAAVKDFCEAVFGDHEMVDDFLSVLKFHGAIEHTEPKGDIISVVTLEIF